MARKAFVLEEILAMLKVSGAPNRVIDAFQKQAEFVAAKQNHKSLDHVTVGSVFGADTRRGYVEFTVNDQLSQLEPTKAREIGLMLLEAAEAATSDEIFVTMLEKIGIDRERAGHVLIDLREIRQGTRGTSWPH
jgi:hypothetical protein